ncbi:MAG: hypothetical protein A2174_02965 [Candidatus Portnoybacteria bacterium RBG_13_41_18]|uniref:Cell division protein FtsL n=1 Tax=Candidatus Portnoybacteria bacterium RBG_13_41_18 TaxID=1801991 RepID=A0A1G2F979_9BACT|nr:MAG: hypothetical protein A2174_02965 [Candidatus Portnoybacteria bacterium RBG_13_41_18]
MNNNQLYSGRNQKNSRGVLSLNIAVFFSFLILTAIFLIESNDLIKQTYALGDYEKTFKDQQALLKKMEIVTTERTTLENLEEAAKDFNLVTIDKMKYLPAEQTSVALVKN